MNFSVPGAETSPTIVQMAGAYAEAGRRWAAAYGGGTVEDPTLDAKFCATSAPGTSPWLCFGDLAGSIGVAHGRRAIDFTLSYRRRRARSMARDHDDIGRCPEPLCIAAASI